MGAPRRQASPVSTLCLLLPGVLLDIQQHFGVKDRGAGLLQSGEVPLPPWPPSCFLIPGGDSLPVSSPVLTHWKGREFCVQIPPLPLTKGTTSPSLCFYSCETKQITPALRACG